MHSRAKLAKTRLAAAAVVAAAAMAVSPLVLGQTCPSTATTGCDIPGITVPNGFENCPATGTNVHSGFPVTTTLCNNQPIDPATWTYGPRNDLTAAQQAAPFWNQVMARMKLGLPVYGKRWTTAAEYCSVATYNATNNHFTWADERHGALTNSTLYPTWQNYCPGLTYDTTAARGALGSSLEEREAQRDADGGADVLFRPVNSVRDAQEAIFWSFWPPFGHRSMGGTSVYDAKIASIGAAPYRASFNTNLVMVAQIATVAGAQAVSGIAAIDGIDALYLDEEDLAFQSAGVADYNQLAKGVRAAAKANGKYLCTVDRTATPNVMTCLPPAQLTAADLVKREWPLRRLDGNGMPFGSTRIAGLASGAY